MDLRYFYTLRCYAYGLGDHTMYISIYKIFNDDRLCKTT